MEFQISDSIRLLESTPQVLDHYLRDLSPAWTHVNEGKRTWSVMEIMGHFIHGEKTDWIPRLKIILGKQDDKTFPPFDMEAHLKSYQGISVNHVLDEFRDLRNLNILELRSLDLTESDLDQTGIHPEFGKVTLRQMLSAWTVHDLGHIAQISRVMAKQYISEVGPWKQYLGILK